jgi:Flp pilus assembly protein TadG
MARKSRVNVGADRGAAAVELGLLLPLLLLIVMGIIDFGGMLNAQNALTQAAREGARARALDQDDVPGKTRSAATSRLITAADVVVDEGDPCPNVGEKAEVTVTYNFQFSTPVGNLAGLFGGDGFDDTMTLTAKGVMPCES